MKKLKYIFLLIYSFPFLVNAQFVEQLEAELVALNFIETKLYQNTLSTKSSQDAVKSSQKIIRKTITKNYNDHKSYYKIIFEGGGFVIVSAIENYEPILAYSLDGEASENDDEASPEYLFWMEAYDYDIDSILATNSQSNEYQSEWILLKNQNLEQDVALRSVTPSSNSFHLMSSRWNQKHPYNSLAPSGREHNCSSPRCFAGCVAVAVSQVMRYWGYPVYSFDWCNMLDEITNESPDVAKNAIAYLISEVGEKTDTKYCKRECASNTGYLKAKQALRDYGYKAERSYRNIIGIEKMAEIIRNEVDAGRPVLIEGNDKLFNGHAWVIDGRDLNNNSSFHFNWGSEENNGFFNYLVAGNDFHKDMSIITVEPENYFNSDNTIHVANTYGLLGNTALSASRNPSTYGHIYNGGTSYEAFRTIPSGVSANYNAYRSVVLSPGFTAKSGSNFKASIVPMPCTYPYNENNRRVNPFAGYRNIRAVEESDFENNNFHFEEGNLNNVLSNNMIYPNPTSDIININLGNQPEDIAKIELYNTNGIKFQEKKPINDIESFEMYLYPQGMYILKITFNNGKSEHHKFIYK